MESLDNILSGRGEAVSADNKPAPAATQPEPTSEPEKEAQQQPAAETGEAEIPEADVNGQRMVPKAALDEARGKAKRYTEQVADFERKLSEQNAAWERRFGQLLETVKPKEQPAEPDWYANPDQAAVHAVSPHLSELQRALVHNSRLVADNIYKPETVQAAEDAFMAAVQNRSIDPADYQKVVGSPNRFDAAVKWHRRQQAMAEIGDDPAAYRARLEAEILAKHGLASNGNGNGAPANSAPAPVMPSNLATVRNVGNRTGPAWGGPMPLADIFDRRAPTR